MISYDLFVVASLWVLSVCVAMLLGARLPGAGVPTQDWASMNLAKHQHKEVVSWLEDLCGRTQDIQAQLAYPDSGKGGRR